MRGGGDRRRDERPPGVAPGLDRVVGVGLAAVTRALVSGRASGPLLRLTAPISLWGGVDPRTGAISDPRHPQHGAVVTGRVVVIPSAVGSSSSSAIMLELIRERTAPAAVLMGRADAILALGVVVARELGYPGVPVLEVDLDGLRDLADGTELVVDGDQWRRAGDGGEGPRHTLGS